MHTEQTLELLQAARNRYSQKAVAEMLDVDVRTVRRWESFVMTQQGVELLRRNRLGIAATNDARLSWEPAYARFDGALRLDMLGVLGSVKNKFMKVPPFTLVRFQIDVQQAGPIDLQFDSAANLQIWLDGKPLEPADLIRTAGELTRAARFRRRPPSSARIPAPAPAAPEPVAEWSPADVCVRCAAALAPASV